MLLLGIILYSLVGVAFVRPVAGHIAWSTSNSYHQKHPDGSDWGWGTFVGIMCAFVWPLLVIAYISDKIMPAIGAEKKMLEKQKDERIKQLERELDIK